MARNIYHPSSGKSAKNDQRNLALAGEVPTSIDITAAGISGLCLLHCLALPLLSAAAPLAGTMSEAEWVHKALVLIAAPFSGVAAFKRGVHSRDLPFVLLITLGFTLLTSAAFIEALHNIEKPLTGIGALTLAGAHLSRWRRHHKH